MSGITLTKFAQRYFSEVTVWDLRRAAAILAKDQMRNVSKITGGSDIPVDRLQSQRAASERVGVSLMRLASAFETARVENAPPPKVGGHSLADDAAAALRTRGLSAIEAQDVASTVVDALLRRYSFDRLAETDVERAARLSTKLANLLVEMQAKETAHAA